MKSIYRRSALLFFVSCFAFYFLAFESSSARAETVTSAEERVTTMVWGVAETGNKAKADAEKKARQKAGGDYVVVKVEVRRIADRYHYHLIFSYPKP